MRQSFYSAEGGGGGREKKGVKRDPGNAAYTPNCSHLKMNRGGSLKRIVRAYKSRTVRMAMRTVRGKKGGELRGRMKPKSDRGEGEENSYKATLTPSNRLTLFLSLSLILAPSLTLSISWFLLYGYTSVGRWHRRDLGIPNSSKPSENSRKVHWERSGAYH